MHPCKCIWNVYATYLLHINIHMQPQATYLFKKKQYVINLQTFKATYINTKAKFSNSYITQDICNLTLSLKIVINFI